MESGNMNPEPNAQEPTRKRPTIAELESMLNSSEALKIEVQPDGSIKAVSDQSETIHRLESANEALRKALEEIFAWWNQGDGHLVTHFPTPVIHRMKELQNLTAIHAPSQPKI